MILVLLLMPGMAIGEPSVVNSLKQLLETPAVEQSGRPSPDQLAPLIIEQVQVIDHGDSMSWYAKTRNPGRRIGRNRLEISAQQMIGDGGLRPGPMTLFVTSPVLLPQGGRG